MLNSSLKADLFLLKKRGIVANNLELLYARSKGRWPGRVPSKGTISVARSQKADELETQLIETTLTAIKPQRELKETPQSRDELRDAPRTSNEVMLKKLKNSLENARQDVHDLPTDVKKLGLEYIASHISLYPVQKQSGHFARLESIMLQHWIQLRG